MGGREKGPAKWTSLHQMPHGGGRLVPQQDTTQSVTVTRVMRTSPAVDYAIIENSQKNTEYSVIKLIELAGKQSPGAEVTTRVLNVSFYCSAHLAGNPLI